MSGMCISHSELIEDKSTEMVDEAWEIYFFHIYYTLEYEEK